MNRTKPTKRDQKRDQAAIDATVAAIGRLAAAMGVGLGELLD